MKKLELSQLDDQISRDNFIKLQEEADNNPFINGEFKKVFEKEFTTAGTLTVNHNLNFKPSDCFITFNTAGVTVSDFTSTSVLLTATAAGKVRFILGRMK